MQHTLPIVDSMSKFTQEDNDFLDHLLNKIKINWLKLPNVTFITTVMASRNHIWSLDYPMAATNGKDIFYNPYFMSKNNIDNCIAVMYHELQHIIFKHNERLLHRDPRKFNAACDYVINNQAVNEGHGYMAEFLYNTKYDETWSSEMVYADLKEDGIPKDFVIDVLPLEDNTPQGVEKFNTELDGVMLEGLIKAEKYGDEPGSIPNSIRMYLHKLTNPTLPWHRILSKYLTAKVKLLYNYNRPRRRNPSEVIMPIQHSEALGNIVAVMDLSASVSDKEVTVYASNLFAVMKQFATTKVTLVQFDTEITNISTIKSAKDVVRNAYVGRGGTEITPVMKWANENKPDVLLIFTDGGLWEPDIKPDCDVVWIVHNYPTFKMSFGKIIHFEIN